MLIRDIEIEQYTSKQAKGFIGKKILKKNVFRPESLPFSTVKQSKESKKLSQECQNAFESQNC